MPIVAVPEAGASLPPGRPGSNRILQYVFDCRWRYLGGLVALIVATVAALLPPFVVQRAVDDLRDGVAAASLARYALLVVLFAGIEGMLRYYSRMVVSGTSRVIEYRLRDDLARHLMSLDHGYYVRARTGDLMSRATNDLQAVRDVLGPSLVDLSRIFVVSIAGVGFMLFIDVRLTLIALLYLPVVIGLMSYFETNVETRFREVQEQLSLLTDRAQENVAGIRAVKAYAQEEVEVASFAAANEVMRRRSMRLALYHSGLLPVMGVLTGAATLLVLWVGGHDVAAGRMTMGEFVAFNFILAILANQLMAVGWVVATAQLGAVAIRRVNEVLRAEPAVRDGHAVALPSPVRGEVEFVDVSVAFDGREVLHNVDLRIPAGATVALVGGTGAGKTTLASLLVRLTDPSGGSVRLDGLDVREWPLDRLRDAIAFVPQEAFLFSDSIRENISYGRPGAADAEYDAATRVSRLSNDLQDLHAGLETTIGERGVTLSGGQKQRAALARALLKQAPVLVLDDALSHVDMQTEEQILHGLREVMRGRTTILIAHRTSTLREAGLIAVIEGGTIVERGSHEELIAAEGAYARIYYEQLQAERRAREQAAVDLGSDGA
ncbi:MAG: ABC transporter ATP-binding protein [Dehalococcoidia bacterium]|nr:MAG: ABC transporter ATP-binding protein [Dehalococcoidia bacterium]